MGLQGRLQIHWASLRSPDRQTRWQTINKLVYWVALLLLAGAAVTGVQLYFQPGLLPSEPLVVVHKWLSWGFVVYVIDPETDRASEAIAVYRDGDADPL